MNKEVRNFSIIGVVIALLLLLLYITGNPDGSDSKSLTPEQIQQIQAEQIRELQRELDGIKQESNRLYNRQKQLEYEAYQREMYEQSRQAWEDYGRGQYYNFDR